jgi:hypothetical protein
MSLPLHWWWTGILTPTLGTGQNHPFIVTLATSLSDSPSACASPKMWERTLRTRSSKSGLVGVGVPAVEVLCTDVVIEDGVVASSSVVLNCTVLLSVAFWGTRVWLYLGLSRNDGVRVDSWECWLPFTCRARRMSTRMSSDSWDQAFRDSGDNRPNVSLGITPDWSRICACTMSVGVSISNPNSYASWKDSVTLASQISVRSANLVGWRFAGAWARY